ncbi:MULTISPECIES: helix-turn-helix domain-containing protein [unclassified Actinomyces]|uniref:PucR family transcriptional regulator n=1 Tax=unclassified Actinomyces TaxID=2609248 RepID=UPI001373C7AC|nr:MULTISPECIES: helix-turn-helix domain-containing protein [unclassified Actinomyces]MBW3069174.1 PucR family transcriptional regulator [Actinomyces sp. 594]NDR54587.1 PucR family transcriptional regulator [Actinomyces sp. 565]QHO91008.1 PucR family transcriptional regulator [Actinomyces sp. 432]
MDQLSAPSVTALRQAQNTLIEHSLDRISAAHPWYNTLPATSRAQIQTVARLGVSMFVDSVGEQSDAAAPSEIFNVAPVALTGTVTLEQTLELVRTVVDVVEEQAPDAVPAADHDAVRFHVLTFGRDVGFAAAKVYARVAEARGAWDARLESVAVDAMLHDSSEDAATRASAAGWRGTGPVIVIVARTTLDALAASRLRHECRQHVSDCLVSVHGDSVVVVLGGQAEKETGDRAAPSPEGLATAADRIASSLGGAVVIGPVVSGVAQAGRSLRSALAGLRALPGWAEAPNPVRADDLLPERMLAGDPLAAEQIQVLVTEPLRAMGDLYEETVATYLALGRSLEMTARTLFVHANTVRYRLGRVSKQIGWDATDARDGLVLHLAVIVGRLATGEDEQPPYVGQ